MVLAFIASENLALTFAVVATPVAPSSGVSITTYGAPGGLPGGGSLHAVVHAAQAAPALASIRAAIAAPYQQHHQPYTHSFYSFSRGRGTLEVSPRSATGVA